MRTLKNQRSPHDLKFAETSTAPFNAPASTSSSSSSEDSSDRIAEAARRGVAGAARPDPRNSSPLSAPATPHTRQGDRGGDDDADAARLLLPIYVRFKDLVAANIATSWPQLLRTIAAEGFPNGIMLRAIRGHGGSTRSRAGWRRGQRHARS
jgi:hypothetical protein